MTRACNVSTLVVRMKWALLSADSAPSFILFNRSSLLTPYDMGTSSAGSDNVALNHAAKTTAWTDARGSMLYLMSSSKDRNTASNEGRWPQGATGWTASKYLFISFDRMASEGSRLRIGGVCRMCPKKKPLDGAMYESLGRRNSGIDDSWPVAGSMEPMPRMLCCCRII